MRRGRTRNMKRRRRKKRTGIRERWKEASVIREQVYGRGKRRRLVDYTLWSFPFCKTSHFREGP